jgi:hypothetical protein
MKLEGIKQNMFDIFNEYPIVQEKGHSRTQRPSGVSSSEQKQELISLNMDVEKIKI